MYLPILGSNWFKIYEGDKKELALIDSGVSFDIL
jgi:hypothetical protein